MPVVPASRAPTLIDWLFALGLLAGVTALGLWIEPHVSLTTLAMLYLLCVVLVAYRTAWWPTAATSIGAVLALNFFFVPPRWTLAVAHPEHLISLGALLVVAVLIHQLTHRLRRETAQARRAEQRARQLQALAQALPHAADADAMRALALDALQQDFAGPVHILLAAAPAQDTDALDAHTLDGLRHSLQTGDALGPGTGRWPALSTWFLPIGTPAERRGAAMVGPAHADRPDDRTHAEAVLALLAQALSEAEAQRALLSAQAETQRQQLQTTFLAAISHDLRTPLAALVGTATTLQSQHARLPEAERARLLDNLADEARYLATLTENLLQLARLNAQAGQLPLQWESIEELAGAALARVRPQDPERRVHVHLAPGLPLVRADPVLLTQLLVNLLDNALRHTTGPVELHADQARTPAGDTVRLSVEDRGAGLSDAVRAHLFQPFAHSDRAGQRGAGLGLALCQAIARTHGGALDAREREGGGTVFALSLPAPPAPPPEGEVP